MGILWTNWDILGSFHVVNKSHLDILRNWDRVATSAFAVMVQVGRHFESSGGGLWRVGGLRSDDWGLRTEN